MKITLVIWLCLLFALSAFAQVGGDEIKPEPPTVGIQDIYLAKDNGEGQAGDAAEYFLTTDVPIYCVVQLNSTKPAIVKMNLVAVNVQGVKAESRVITVSFKTNGRQDLVNFKGKPDGAWVAGSYRIDVFIDDNLAIGKSFEIKKSTSELHQRPAVESFLPPKSKPKPRIVKTSRKN